MAKFLLKLPSMYYKNAILGTPSIKISVSCAPSFMGYMKHTFETVHPCSFVINEVGSRVGKTLNNVENF